MFEVPLYGASLGHNVPPKFANDLGQHLDIDIIEIDVQPPRKWWKRNEKDMFVINHMLSHVVTGIFAGILPASAFFGFLQGTISRKPWFFFSGCRSWFCWKSWQRGAQK